MAEERLLPTPHGEARAFVFAAAEPWLTLVLQPGASGKLDAPDLAVLAANLPDEGVTTILIQPSFAVAGKKLASRPTALDDDLLAVLPALALQTPLVVGGHSAGARSSARSAVAAGAVGCLCLSFPLHPPGRPEKSRLPELLGAGVRTLVVQGASDTFGRPEEFPDLPAGMRLVPVAGAGHALAKPDVVLDVVRSWLRESPEQV